MHDRQRVAITIPSKVISLRYTRVKLCLLTSQDAVQTLRRWPIQAPCRLIRHIISVIHDPNSKRFGGQVQVQPISMDGANDTIKQRHPPRTTEYNNIVIIPRYHCTITVSSQDSRHPSSPTSIRHSMVSSPSCWNHLSSATAACEATESGNP